MSRRRYKIKTEVIKQINGNGETLNGSLNITRRYPYRIGQLAGNLEFIDALILKLEDPASGKESRSALQNILSSSLEQYKNSVEEMFLEGVNRATWDTHLVSDIGMVSRAIFPKSTKERGNTMFPQITFYPLSVYTLELRRRHGRISEVEYKNELKRLELENARPETLAIAPTDVIAKTLASLSLQIEELKSKLDLD